jgi:hypothetical protein
VAVERPVQAPDYSPLPLPGSPAQSVNVIPVQGRRG